MPRPKIAYVRWQDAHFSNETVWIENLKTSVCELEEVGFLYADTP